MADEHLWVKRIYPGDWDAIADRLFADVYAERRGTYEYRLRDRWDRIRWISQTNRSSWNSTENCWYLTAVSVDISHRKQAELALQESESMLRQVTENLPMFFGLRPLNYSQWLYVNPVYEAITGRSIDTLYSDPTSWLQLVHPEDVDAVAGNQVLPHRPQPVVNNFRVLRGENDVRWVRSIEFPVLNSEGKPYRVVTFAEDVTAQTRAAATLRESEERFRRAFDDAPIGMALTTLYGQSFQVNAAFCQFLGYTSEELLAMTINTVSHPEDMTQDQAFIDEMLLGKRQTYQMEKRYVHKQGHPVYGLLSVSLVRDSGNRPLYFVAQVQDISERYKIDRMKQEFISIVSHELRTPLTSIRGSLGILAAGVLNNRPEKAQRMTQVALDNADRLIRLVNNILDLERLESGRVQLVKAPGQIADLMQQAVDSLEAIALEANITLQLTPVDQVVWVAADAVVQTLTNLVSNAIKFSEPGSTVWLSADRLPTENALRIAVRDQGRGIPPDKLELIFERFQQVDASDSRQKGGTGLGLAICKTIVEQHGGTLEVDSTVGAGSTFYITLPIGAS